LDWLQSTDRQAALPPVGSMMKNEQTRPADCTAFVADRPKCDLGRKRPLLLAAALAAETLWLAALAAMAWRNIAS